MFCTTRDVKKFTNYDVTAEQLGRAQGILEVYIGRLEIEITDMRDKALLGRALAYQAAYMVNDTEKIFEQVALAQVGVGDSISQFKAGDFTSPWIAPLTVLTCDKLSWFRSRSVHTGKVFQKKARIPWERD
jgi:hypothetical protein